MVRVSDIYAYLDEIMPFSAQEEWDNSGLLVGSGETAVTKVLTCLDITLKTVYEAERIGAQLVVSHHPVIFHPLKRVMVGTPVYELIRSGISAVCCHTNADNAVNYGTNAAAYELMKKNIALGEKTPLPDGVGWMCDTPEMSAKELAQLLAGIFGRAPRYTAGSGSIKRIGFCSGSGGSMLADAAAAGCDAYITGDVKHDVFVDAENMGAALYDCGHYETELPFAAACAGYISERFTDTAVSVSGDGRDYILSL
ncbi:MAG: Nif3-like dinuclear metal center hexameric protein [Oscillospiraceae bacterium]|nr:Nif3-like dinuclear metal center hexameric protein [Oscillospiraceae bacterium]